MVTCTGELFETDPLYQRWSKNNNNDDDDHDDDDDDDDDDF